MSGLLIQPQHGAVAFRSSSIPVRLHTPAGQRWSRQSHVMPVRAQQSEPTDRQNKGTSETRDKARYDKGATEVDLLQPAFTRRREVFVGRLAMVGFVSGVLGELFTGQGVLGQVGLYTGLSRPIVQALVLGIVAFNYLAAVNPKSPTWSFENQRDVRKKPAEHEQDPGKDAAAASQGFSGISKAVGFTKRNEVLVGRVAMIGFAAAIVGEIQTGGKGPLGQLALPIHTPVNPELTGFGLAVWIGFSFFTAIGLGALGRDQGGEDML